MAAIGSHLISHQDYCNFPAMRRLVRIDEKEADITHFIDFVINEQFQLIARVVHRQVDLKRMPQVEVAEDKIYYIADRPQVDDDSGLPANALPFPQLPNRDKIIADLNYRKVVVIDIKIDHRFYQKLADHKTANPSNNETYILMAPEHQAPVPSLHFSPSASLAREATPPESQIPYSPPLNLYYEPSLEPDLEAAPKPAGEKAKITPTAYQEIPEL
jgi:hypothetical protein